MGFLGAVSVGTYVFSESEGAGEMDESQVIRSLSAVVVGMSNVSVSIDPRPVHGLCGVEVDADLVPTPQVPDTVR